LNKFKVKWSSQLVSIGELVKIDQSLGSIQAQMLLWTRFVDYGTEFSNPKFTSFVTCLQGLRDRTVKNGAKTREIVLVLLSLLEASS
jgi:hypothetical protein